MTKEEKLLFDRIEKDIKRSVLKPLDREMFTAILKDEKSTVYKSVKDVADSTLKLRQVIKQVIKKIEGVANEQT